MFPATLPGEVCFLFPYGQAVVFIHELLRSDVYALERGFHTCWTPKTQPLFNMSNSSKEKCGHFRLL